MIAEQDTFFVNYLGTRTRLNVSTVLGMGIPDVEHRVVQPVQQYTRLVAGFTLQPRLVQLIVNLKCPVVASRQVQHELFAPSTHYPTFDFEASLANGGYYILKDVHCVETVEITSLDPSRGAITYRLLASYPIWEARAERSEAILATESTLEALVFGDAVLIMGNSGTFLFGALAGSGTIDITRNITVRGTWLAYPAFEITGPMNNCTIDNVTLGTKLSLLYPIAAWDRVFITLKPRGSTIVNQAGDDLTGYLTDDSDYGWFYLDPTQGVGGVNQLRFRATNAASIARWLMTWHDCYIALG